ncbi:MAG: UDP-N-acetylglucosamine 1-carboxyvinyltransferase [Janthinobacterium lividum]
MKYVITGGQPIVGTIQNLGAKNFATKAMVASLLAAGKTTLTNAPYIGDVLITGEMLESVGAKLTWHDNALDIDTSSLSQSTVCLPDSGSNRIPILLLSVLLNRLGEAHVPTMGGCNIGQRPVDFHLNAAEMFGATIEVDDQGYHAYRKQTLTSCHYALPYPSVGATETCLFLAVLAKGTSIIKNVAIEPEIVSLVTMLNTMGARIKINPNRELVIHGVEKLEPTNFHVLGDRIEAASWAALAAATNGRITVKGIEPTTLINFFAPFNAVGGGIKVEDPTTITFFQKHKLKSTLLETDVYPGFATDWQQPFAIMLTQAEGVSVIHETVYENRFGYLKDLAVFGVKSQIEKQCLGSVSCRYQGLDYPHSVMISGSTPLVSDNLSLDIPDLRAGLAYLMVAALAEGQTTLTSIEKIERGYGNLPVRLKNLNLKLEKV